MTKKTILWIVLFAVIAAAGLATGIYFSMKGKQAEDLSQSKDLIGGDRDEHGCLIAAGYSWDEERKECVRPWEQSAKPLTDEEVLADELKQLFAQKYAKSKDEIKITINERTPGFVYGGVTIGEGAEGGGIFYAMLDKGGYRLVFDGNGAVDCPGLRALGFPETMLKNSCDPLP